ncbi:MAG: hypothetical protein MAG795_00591 [Candidatus Woesearchaeota archaeon]|nr:hypothetical protein [Candidatus Woesearchaeota archaeon]
MNVDLDKIFDDRVLYFFIDPQYPKASEALITKLYP